MLSPEKGSVRKSPQKELNTVKYNLCLLFFAIGALLPNYFPYLPSWETLAVCLLFVLSLLVGLSVYSRVFPNDSRVFPSGSRVFPGGYTWAWLAVFAGLAVGCVQAKTTERFLLAQEYDQKLFNIVGNIRHVETRGDGSQRMVLQVNTLKVESGAWLTSPPRKILLSYYGKSQLDRGASLTVIAKLRRPRGLQNTGLFDYQKWLVSEGIDATGYIREIVLVDPVSSSSRWLSLDTTRLKAKSLLTDTRSLQYPGVHAALTFGEDTLIVASTWDLFRATGTMHLLVISGLHVGLLAAIGYWFGFAIGRCLSVVNQCNAVRSGIVAALLFALVYCALCSFTVPALRAFIMISAALFPRYFYLNTSRWFGFFLALALVAVLEPQAPLRIGFWLSFGAVLLLFMSFSSSKGNFIVGLVKTQVLFLVSFCGVLLWQGGTLSPAHFLANMVAVPVLSLLLVPLEMMALSVMWVSEVAAVHLWKWCDQIVVWTIDYFQFVEALDLPRLYRPAHWSWFLYLSSLSAFLLWFVPGWRLKCALCMACLPLWFPREESALAFHLQVFDVGQGLALLLQQPNYTLIYDTGRQFSPSFDSGADIIGATLHQHRVSVVDTVVISHPDSDHRGGLEGLASEVDINTLFSGRHFMTGLGVPQTPCRKGQRWVEGEVEYRFLWPDQPDDRSGAAASSSAYLNRLSDNDISCVLLVTGPGFRILIPGDISAYVERRLVRDYPEISGVDVLIVPHHGSKTSSSEVFLEKVQPKIAVVSAGYRNQFRHPHPQVVERYTRVGAEILNTGDVGAISMGWKPGKEGFIVKTATELKLFWWQK